jgi:hypothetical protein
VVASVALVSTFLLAPAADAATTGANTATLTVAPPAVRSLTVTPSTSTFANCSGSNASQLAIPNGTCSVGTVATSVTGGVTVTNGSVPGEVFVNGGNAVPSDAGTPWTLAGTIWIGSSVPTPGANQYDEATTDYSTNGSGQIFTSFANTAICDHSFSPNAVPGGSCTASAGQVGQEALDLVGPSSSTDAGPFSITTTWTAAP